MSNPLFSVIVPVYNVEKYIRECIESVLNQTYKDFELILVDDGSTDNSGKICDQYARRDERIKVVHKENGGLVSARKAGVNVAHGEYSIAVDGDDYIREDALQLFFDIITAKMPDVICFGFYYVYGDRVIEKINRSSASKLYDKEKMRSYIYPRLIENAKGQYFSNSICGKVINTDSYKRYQNLVDNRIKIGEDAACTKPLIFNCDSMYILNESLYYYRQNNESMTKNRKAFDLAVPKMIGEHFENTIDMTYGDNQEQVYRFVVHQLFNACYSQFYRKDDISKIKADIRKILKYNYYEKAVANCFYSFKYGKGILVLLSIKYKLFGLLAIWAKVKLISQ